ncbi:MAG: hypothetical protein ACUVV3_07535 [Dehalococcoidia bacterium]
MRPNPVEILRGVQQTLTLDVLPELTTPYAQDRVQLSLMLLQAVAQEWDTAADSLVKDNREMRDIFREAIAVIASIPQASRPKELRGLFSPLRTAARQREDDSFAISALTERNNELKGLLERLLVACEEAAGNPRLEALMPLRQRIYDHLWEVDIRGWAFWDPLAFRGRVVSRRGR